MQIYIVIPLGSAIEIPTKLSAMKKLIYTGLVLSCVLGMASCDYDDSNDLDLLIPNDSIPTVGTESVGAL